MSLSPTKTTPTNKSGPKSLQSALEQVADSLIAVTEGYRLQYQLKEKEKNAAEKATKAKDGKLKVEKTRPFQLSRLSAATSNRSSSNGSYSPIFSGKRVSRRSGVPSTGGLSPMPVKLRTSNSFNTSTSSPSRVSFMSSSTDHDTSYGDMDIKLKAKTGASLLVPLPQNGPKSPFSPQSPVNHVANTEVMRGPRSPLSRSHLATPATGFFSISSGFAIPEEQEPMPKDISRISKTKSWLRSSTSSSSASSFISRRKTEDDGVSVYSFQPRGLSVPAWHNGGGGSKTRISRLSRETRESVPISPLSESSDRFSVPISPLSPIMRPAYTSTLHGNPIIEEEYEEDKDSHSWIEEHKLNVAPAQNYYFYNKELPEKRAESPDFVSPLEDVSSVREFLIGLVLCSSPLYTFTALAQTLAPTQIIGSHHMGFVAWFSAAYFLSIGLFALPAARLANLIGHRPVFLAATCWFAIWNLLAGMSGFVRDGDSVAGGVVFYGFCRVMLGMGPAGTLTSAISMITKYYPYGIRRNVAMGFFSATVPVGLVFGAMLTGISFKIQLNGFFGPAFCIMAVLSTTTALLGAWVLPKCPSFVEPVDPQRPQTWKTRTIQFCRRMDIIGALLGIFGFALIVFAWNQSVAVGLTTFYVEFLLILGILVFAGFLYYQISLAEYPMFALHDFGIKTSLIFMCVAEAWWAFGIWIFYFVEYMIKWQDYAALFTGASLAPAPVIGTVTALVTAVGLRCPTGYWFLLGANISIIVSLAMLGTAGIQQNYFQNPLISVILIAAGLPTLSCTAPFLINATIPMKVRNMSSGLLIASSFGSMAVSLGVAGTIELNIVKIKNADRFQSFRHTVYFGIGMAGFAVLMSLIFTIVHMFTRRKTDQEALDDDMYAQFANPETFSIREKALVV